MGVPGSPEEALKRMADQVSGNTPANPKRRRVYLGPTPQTDQVLARTTHCPLCFNPPGKTKKTIKSKGVIEHLHRSLLGDGSGPVRGHACRRCNRLEADSLKVTLEHFHISKKDFMDESKPLPDGFFEYQAKVLQVKLDNGLKIDYLVKYLTGQLFAELVEFISK